MGTSRGSLPRLSFIPAIDMGTTANGQFSVVLALERGHKFSGKGNLLGPFSRTFQDQIGCGFEAI